MSEYKTINDIINEKRDYIADYTAKIAAWSAVEIKTKKDGTEFKELTNRCIEGAKMVDKFFVMYSADKELEVFYTGKRTYNHDSIDCCGYCDELPDGDERKVLNNPAWHRARYALTPSEMREAIAARIERYKEYKAEQEQALEWLEANADALKAKMEAFRADLFDGAPDDIGIRHAFGDIVGDGLKFGFR